MSQVSRVECVSAEKKLLILEDKELNILVFGEDKNAVSNLLGDFFSEMLLAIQDESTLKELMCKN